MRFHEHGTCRKTLDGAYVIEVQVGSPTERMGFEDYLPSPERMGYGGHDRAHAIGAGFGVECPYGIGYSPQATNQEVQNRGIEDFIRTMHEQRADGVTLHCLVERKLDGLAVQSDQYHLYAEGPDGQRVLIFEAGYEHNGPKGNRRAEPNVKFWNEAAFDAALKPTAKIDRLR